MSDKSAPFDAVAAAYDADFTDTPLGRRKREIVHSFLVEQILGQKSENRRILELNCGTGEDALFLSQYVREVTATDISAEMIGIARRKVESAGRNNVRFVQMGIEELWNPDRGKDRDTERKDLRELIGSEPFDLIFSNFDGLNCLPDLSPLPDGIRSILAPNGHIVLVVMSGFCAVETFGFALRGKFGRALQRFRRDGVPVNIGGGVSVRTWFHPTHTLIRLFRNTGFRLRAVRAVGLLIPPTSMRDFYHRHRSGFRRLESLEGTLSPHFPFNRMGDNVLLHFQRADSDERIAE